jgi:hypothetical protein
MDWRKNGEKLRALVSEENCRSNAFVDAIEEVLDREFSTAMHDLVMNHNRKRLIEWLRSDQPLTVDERKYVANALETALVPPLPRGRGRPRKWDVRWAARSARLFYERWRRFNQETGVYDYGHRSEMRDEAIRFVLSQSIGSWTASDHIDPDKVRTLMDLASSRRK